MDLDCVPRAWRWRLEETEDGPSDVTITSPSIRSDLSFASRLTSGLTVIGDERRGTVRAESSVKLRVLDRWIRKLAEGGSILLLCSLRLCLVGCCATAHTQQQPRISIAFLAAGAPSRARGPVSSPTAARLQHAADQMIPVDSSPRHVLVSD